MEETSMVVFSLLILQAIIWTAVIGSSVMCGEEENIQSVMQPYFVQEPLHMDGLAQAVTLDQRRPLLGT